MGPIVGVEPLENKIPMMMGIGRTTFIDLMIEILGLASFEQTFGKEARNYVCDLAI